MTATTEPRQRNTRRSAKTNSVCYKRKLRGCVVGTTRLALAAGLRIALQLGSGVCIGLRLRSWLRSLPAPHPPAGP